RRPPDIVLAARQAWRSLGAANLQEGDMAAHTSGQEWLDPETRAFYRQALVALHQSGIPFLVGGAYALTHYTGILRHTKDFDIFVRPADFEPILDVLSTAGYQTEVTFPHWLGKALYDSDNIDV